MPNRFSAYGRLIASYEGSGELRLLDGTAIPCAFEAAQLVSGQVMVRCIDPASMAFDATTADKFIGRTAENHLVIARGLVWAIDLGRRSTSAKTGIITTYSCTQLSVTFEPGTDAVPAYASFGLTNFDFRPWQRSPLPVAAGGSERVLSVAVQDGEQLVNVVIRPLPRYQARHRRVRALRSIDVTCELVLPVTPDHDLKHITDMAQDISDLLSFARGTPVAIVYRDLERSDGVRFCRNHTGAFAKRYVPFPLLDPRRARETRRFLKNALPVYRQWKSALNLKEIVRAALDGRQDADYLQLRGVKMAAVAEMLTASFLSSNLIDINDYRMKPVEFERLVVSKLKQELRRITEANELSEELRKELSGKLGDLNHQNFREKIASVCRYVRLDASRDLQPFVRSRNRLIHSGRFISDSSKPKDRELCEAMGWTTNLHEYYFMVDLIDRIILRLLGYEGIYVDISTWPAMASKILVVAPSSG